MVALENVGEFVQQRATLKTGGPWPGPVIEGTARRGDGLEGVGRGGLADGGDERPVGRAVDLAAAARDRVAPGTGNEQVSWQVRSSPHAAWVMADGRPMMLCCV